MISKYSHISNSAMFVNLHYSADARSSQLKETGNYIDPAEKLRNNMVNIICKELNIAKEKMFQLSRNPDKVLARYVFMYLLYSTNTYTLQKIGEYAKCEGREAFNHGTVLHAVKTINDRRDTDKVFRAVLERIEMQVK